MAKKKKSGGDAPVLEGKAAEVKKKKKTSPLEFIQQVRNEAAKVTWTTRNETLVSTIMVLIMVAIMSLFFFGVDQGLRFAVCNILPIDCVGVGN
ncbi:preprotein translocase subunit SecE [Hyphococcus sp. DH-69]|uniref:preprotein translocase subunit SecE n=1 Tax=Hyphococcus formosus TaxID=3143534 RepID=UPI00398AF983